MGQGKFLLVIVLYKEHLSDTSTWNTLLKYKDEFSSRVDLYVHDNSPSPQSIPAQQCVRYYHDPSNGGLSLAYNRAARYADEHAYEWLLLLDQDTVFPAETLRVYLSAIDANSNLSVFVPQLVYGQDATPFSPVELSSLLHPKGVFLDEGEYTWSHYSMVNCGLCVRTSLFLEAGGYNECVRLDFADFQFVNRLRKVSAGFFRIGVVAHQSFSNSEKDASLLLNRFKLYIESARNCEKFSMQEKLGFFYNVLRHSVALTFRTKKLHFLKIFVMEYCMK